MSHSGFVEMARPSRLAFVLVHSPLVGPSSWGAVADELRGRGFTAFTPDLDGSDEDGTPLWRQHARAAATEMRALLSPAVPVVLVGHSGAGALLPAIASTAAKAVAAYLFVDAGLPSVGPRKGRGEFAAFLARMHSEGRRFPDWTEAQFRDVVSDVERRRSLLADLRPQPPRFWEESPIVAEQWPDAPCGYLRFVPNPAYDDAAEEARRRGWMYRELVGGHFHMLVDPGEVASSIAEMATLMSTKTA